MPMKMITKNRKSGNGLEIRTTFTDLEESPRRRSLIDYFFLSVILCLGILGMVFTTASCFSIPIFVPLTVYVLAFAAFFSCLTFYLPKAWRFCLPAGILLYLLFFRLYGDSIREGLFWTFSSILTQVNEYFGSSYTLPPLYNEIQSFSGTAAMSALFLPFCPLLSWLLLRPKRSYGYLLILGAGFLWPFCIGTSADTASGILIFLSALLSISVRGGKKWGRAAETHIQKKSGPVMLLMIVLSLSVGLAFLTPLIEKSLENRLELKRTFNSYLTRIDPFDPGSAYTERGVGSGDLARISSLAGTVSNDLRLTLAGEAPVLNIYLEGYIGAEYTNLGWEPADSDRFQEQFSAVRADNPGAFIRNISYPNYYMNVEAVKESNRYQNLDIELMNADPSYYYTPYVSYYEDDMTLCADSYIYGNQESSYSVAYDPLFIVNYIPIGSKIEVEGIKDSDLKRLYNDYVNKTYLQVPDRLRKQFQEDVARTASEDPITTVHHVLSLLKEQTTYDTSPGRVPVGRDFAEYFFYHNKKGFCVHYATTAVLMLRMNGIPARFVSGYRVSPGEFQKKDNGTYQAVVTSEDAHAWVELYIDNIGWLMAEATPGFDRVDFGDGTPFAGPENQDSEDNGATPTPTPSATPVPSAASDTGATADGSEDGSDFANGTSRLFTILFPYIGCIITGILALSAIALGIIKSLRAYHRFGNHTNEINERIRQTYLSISRLLTLDGLPEKPEYPNEEWARILTGKYPDLPAGMFGEILEDTRKACYAEKQLPEFSLEFMIQKYEMLRRSLYAKRSRIAKIWLWIRE